MFERDGSDIIFIAGAPGSKWSAVAHALMYADDVNLSDISLDRSHKESRALHFGNYFGPGMEFGRGFVDLTSFSKDELLTEFAAPFREAGGVKLLKSHFFSRHLFFLAETFPKARFVLVHRPDSACLEWWKQAGGFSIQFPDYTWYGDLDRMSAQISLDNEGILDFAKSRSARIVRRRSIKPVVRDLGLSYSAANMGRVAALEFEQRYGFGTQDLEEIVRTIDAVARSTSTGVA